MNTNVEGCRTDYRERNKIRIRFMVVCLGDYRMANRTALVTGAGGFVGSHLVECLIENGYAVRGLVRYSSSSHKGCLEYLPPFKRDQFDIVAGNLRDAESIADSTLGVDVVFHLGALVSVPYSFVHPREVVEMNVLGTLNVLSACRHRNVKRIVYVSTSEVYGTAQYVPIDENHPLRAQSPYAASKISAEKLVESFYATYDLPVVIIRPFNIYGPRQTARAVIPTIVSQGLTSSKVRLGNTKVTRDFAYVKDVVDGLARAADNQEAVGKTINLGSGREITIEDLVAMIASLSGKDLEIQRDQSRIRPHQSEVERLLAANERARGILGWEPVTPLKEGLRQTLKWIEANISRYDVGEYQV